MFKIRNILLFLLLVIIHSCEPEIKSFKPSAGDADFTVYVAIGNSLTAGFADNELFKSGQIVSFANIMAKQMIHTGGGEFKQPLMKDELGLGNKLRLGYSTDCLGNENLGPVFVGGTPDPGNIENIFSEEGPFHNLAVPGARISHITDPAFSQQNTYFARFASSSSASIIDDALALDPTFFSLWIGGNDILGYALSGGTSGYITQVEDFNFYFRDILSKITSKASRGVLANIPDITSIPFFNTIPSAGLVITNQTDVDNLNDYYSWHPEVSFEIGLNRFVVMDEGSPHGGLRHIKPGELLLLSLPQDSILCGGWGSYTPIPGQFYLSENQISEIQNTTNEYNGIIKSLAGEYNLAFADVNRLLMEASSGITFDGITFSTRYVTGGVFSLDGVHLSPRGNAIVANQFIDAINDKYGSSIPRVSPTQFPGIVFP